MVSSASTGLASVWAARYRQHRHDCAQNSRDSEKGSRAVTVEDDLKVFLTETDCSGNNSPADLSTAQRSCPSSSSSPWSSPWLTSSWSPLLRSNRTTNVAPASDSLETTMAIGTNLHGRLS